MMQNPAEISAYAQKTFVFRPRMWYNAPWCNKKHVVGVLYCAVFTVKQRMKATEEKTGGAPTWQ